MNLTSIEKHSLVYEGILDRYLKHYISDSQLDRYVSVGQITFEESLKIKSFKNFKERE